jgi:hypothetical protein
MSEDTTQTAEVVQEQPTAPSLQISDLVLALQTLHAAAQRGAIRADEMSTVGPLYDRLFAFLEAQGAITRQATQPNQTGDQNA